jgi:hypothetical protein
MTQLYKLERGSRFKLDAMPTTPPDSLDVDIDEIYKLVKLDGMYCWCRDGGMNNHYFAAWTEVTGVDND